MPESYKGGSHRPQSAVFPDTAMANAFLHALVRLVSTHHTRKVVLPTGIANVDELVLRALGLIRDDRRAPR